jgi:hypothetical protein
MRRKGLFRWGAFIGVGVGIRRRPFVRGPTIGVGIRRPEIGIGIRVAIAVQLNQLNAYATLQGHQAFGPVRLGGEMLEAALESFTRGIAVHGRADALPVLPPRAHLWGHVCRVSRFRATTVKTS